MGKHDQHRLNVQDDVRKTDEYQKNIRHIQEAKENAAKNISEPKVDFTLNDPCTCGLYPNGSCLGRKPCPHE